MNSNKYHFTFLLIFILAFETSGQTLSRKAFLGMITSEKNHSIIIDSIISKSTSEKLGLQKNDILVSMNHQIIKSLKQLTELTSKLRIDESINIEFQRDGKVYPTETSILGKPLFKADWCNVSYQSIRAIGCTVRTIIYTPTKKTKTPGIFFIPSYNCGSIENFPGNYNGKLIEQWVRNGYTVYTVEKSGMGDSYGCKSCAEVDLQTDIELFETAYNDFSNLENLDKNNLFIWGHSMGGIIAPIIAQHKSVRGIMVFGTVYRPWSEFLLEMHRVQKPLIDSLTYEQTEEFVRLIQKVYYEFFVLKKSPVQLHEIPEYKNIVETELEYKPGKEDMWGRHWRFWQQLDSINLAKAWQELNCKVLVLHGASDFIQCSALEPYLILQAVNNSHPNHAISITIPNLDHLVMNSIDFKAAVQNMNSKEYLKDNFNLKLVEETIKWMNEIRQ